MDSDRMFIEEMIPHHQDAVDMGEMALVKAEHPETPAARGEYHPRPDQGDQPYAGLVQDMVRYGCAGIPEPAGRRPWDDGAQCRTGAGGWEAP